MPQSISPQFSQRAQHEDGAPVRVQVCRLPPAARRARWLIPIFGTIALFEGLFLIRMGFLDSDLNLASIGLLAGLLGLASLVSLGLMHGIVAREVRFTLDSMVIRQSFRRDLVLPYAGYQHDWVADASNERFVRIITFGRNRGCTVIFPPQWFLDALREIARIQQEEGWYDPELPAERDVSSATA